MFTEAVSYNRVVWTLRRGNYNNHSTTATWTLAHIIIYYYYTHTHTHTHK